MPTYDYVCEECGYEIEVYQSFNDDKLVNCPECQEPKLNRLIGCGAHFFVKGDAKTLQHQAERNSQKMGRAECQERELKSKEVLEKARRTRGLKQREKAETPWWRDGTIPNLVKNDQPITPEQSEKYKGELESQGCRIHPNAIPPKEIINAKK